MGLYCAQVVAHPSIQKVKKKFRRHQWVRFIDQDKYHMQDFMLN